MSLRSKLYWTGTLVTQWGDRLSWMTSVWPIFCHTLFYFRKRNRIGSDFEKVSIFARFSHSKERLRRWTGWLACMAF